MSLLGSFRLVKRCITGFIIEKLSNMLYNGRFDPYNRLCSGLTSIFKQSSFSNSLQTNPMHTTITLLRVNGSSKIDLNRSDRTNGSN